MKGKEKERNDAVLVPELNPVHFRAAEMGIGTEAGTKNGKGAAVPASSNGTLCW